MDYEPVESTMIEAVGYDPEQRQLGVRFKRGATYVYDDIDPEEHQALLGADSVGRHFQTLCGGRTGRRT